MANKNEIINEIRQVQHTGQISQDMIRRKYLKKLSEYTHNTTIIYFSSFPCKTPGISSNLLSIGEDDIQGFMTCINGTHGDSLDLILHSPGGSLEAAEHIVQYLRSKYKYIRAIVPQSAMSAATMVACACDEIVLGKESAIGPIDPQIIVTGPNNVATSMPANSILEDFRRAEVEVASNPMLAAIWAPKLASIPLGMLDFCEKTIDLSKAKVEEWLNSYMFKDDDEKKGHEVAEWLGDFGEHKTHGRPINYDLAKEKGLKVRRLEDDPELQDLVLSVYHATLVTFDVTPCIKLIENQDGKGSYLLAQPQVSVPSQIQVSLPQSPPQFDVPPEQNASI